MAVVVSTGCRSVSVQGFRCPAVCVPSLCPCLLVALLLCLWCVACKYGSISRFKGVFSVVWGVRVGLCCLGALRGLCGFCVREWLGGLKACGVFALYFVLLSFLFPLLPSCPAWLPALPAFLLFVLISWLCGLAFGVGWVLAFFPFRTASDTKRKGAPCWCVLSWCVVGCWLDVLKHHRYFLRFIVPVSITVAGDSCHIFRPFR